jgi:hypothetical protein
VPRRGRRGNGSPERHRAGGEGRPVAICQAEGDSVLVDDPADARGTKVGSVVGSDTRGRFEGLEVTRPSHRYDRFEVGVAAGVGPVLAGPDLGKYARSRTRRARRIVFVVWPATFAVI